MDLQMAEALTTAGHRVRAVWRFSQVPATVDPALAALVADELARHHVEVHTGTIVTAIEPNTDPAGGRLTVTGHATFNATAATGVRSSRTVDPALVVVAVRPDPAMAQTAGTTPGARSAPG